MKDDIEGVVICTSRVEDHKGKMIYGTTYDECSKCGHTVLVSPSTLDIMEKHKDHPIRFLCIPCLGVNLPKDAKVMPINKDQWRELKEITDE